MSFSRTWKILEYGCFQHGYEGSFGILLGKILKYPRIDKLCVILNSVYVMFVHLTVYNIFHRTNKKYSFENDIFNFYEV